MRASVPPAGGGPIGAGRCLGPVAKSPCRFRWRIHKPHPTDTAVRVPGLRAHITLRAPGLCGHTSRCAPQKATPTPPYHRDSGTRQTHNSAPLVPPTPHTPHALACSPPPGVLSLASCVRIRRAANAKPLSYSEHSRSRSAADRIPPPRPPGMSHDECPQEGPATIDIHTWSA